MKQWLMRVIAAAILCTIAQDLSPKGSVKQVGRLVCAMVLLCASCPTWPCWGLGWGCST